MASFLAELQRKVPKAEALAVVENSDNGGTATRTPYAQPEYWEERYQTDGPTGANFEWLLTWAELRTSLAPELEQLGARAAETRILHPGCGNSTLGVDLKQDGFGRGGILNTDISSTVIHQMRAQFPDSTWEVDDCLDMAVARCWSGDGDEGGPVGQYQVVIDKSTLDCLITVDGSEQVKAANVGSYLDQIKAVLTPEGTLVVISNGAPEVRRKLFDRLGWRLIREPGRIKKAAEQSGGKAAPPAMAYFIYVLVPLERAHEGE